MMMTRIDQGQLLEAIFPIAGEPGGLLGQLLGTIA